MAIHRTAILAKHFALVAMLALTLVLPATLGTAAQSVDAKEASLRILRRGMSVQRDGSHLPLLFALRQIRDPDIRPVFEQLLESEHWQVQVHAILGLGEISESNRIDAALIRKVAPVAQDAIIATALDLKLLHPDQFAELLEWDGLEPMARLVLVAELVSLKQSADAASIRTFSEAEDLHIAGLAACLLTQLGEPPAFAAVRSRLTSMSPNRRAEAELWLLEAIRRYKLTACTDWVQEILDRADVDPDVAYRAVYTMLALDPARGLIAWNKQLGDNTSYHHRVRFALLLLAGGVSASDAHFNRLKPAADEELLLRLIAVGKAIAAHADPSGPLIQLLSLNHLKSVEWAMQYLTELPDAQSATVYRHLIDRITDTSTGDEVSIAVAATSRLNKIDREFVFDNIRSAPDDSMLQQALLLGVIESDDHALGELAKSMRRIGAGRADSLTLLLIAKHSPTIDPTDLELLGKVASGGGRISEVLQVQAAWMYLKHSGQVDRAVTQLFE